MLVYVHDRHIVNFRHELASETALAPFAACSLPFFLFSNFASFASLASAARLTFS